MSYSKSNNAKHMREMCARVFQQMLETRGWKYRTFLRYLKLFKYLSLAPTRGKFLESFYALMHYIDDVVDGDVPLPENYKDEHHYLIEKIKFFKTLDYPKDEIDYLMLYCVDLAKEFGEDFQVETEDILNSLLFDVERRGKLIIFPKKVLMNHYHTLDIKGTIRATLKIFREDPDKYIILEPLGVACRHHYDIEDFTADIKAGYVNIPKEECNQFDITQEDFNDYSSPKIKSWLRLHAENGLDLLKEHRRRMPEGEFSLLVRATFSLVYELPARKIFQKIISETENF